MTVCNAAFLFPDLQNFPALFPSKCRAWRLLCSGCVETAYLFPGIGLGCIVSRANRLRDEAFIAAAEALAKLVTDGEPPSGKQKLH